MRLRPLPLVVVPGLLQLVSARPAARPAPRARRARAAFRRENRAGGRLRSGAWGCWGPGAAGDLGLGARAAEGVWGFALEVEAEESEVGFKEDPEAAEGLLLG